MTGRELENQRRKESIAAGLRSHRAARKVSQREFADEVNANGSTVSAWENTGCVSAADAWAAADYYGVSIDELVGRNRSAHPAAS